MSRTGFFTFCYDCTSAKHALQSETYTLAQIEAVISAGKLPDDPNGFYYMQV